MMPYFGFTSKQELATLHPDLRELLVEAIQFADFAIIQGRRSIQEQRENVRRGVSKTMDSKHLPRNDSGELDENGWAWAADIAPYPIAWPNPSLDAGENLKRAGRFYHVVGLIRGIAEARGIRIRVGADWDGDYELRDQTFDDLGHIELITPRAA